MKRALRSEYQANQALAKTEIARDRLPPMRSTPPPRPVFWTLPKLFAVMGVASIALFWLGSL